MSLGGYEKLSLLDFNNNVESFFKSKEIKTARRRCHHSIIIKIFLTTLTLALLISLLMTAKNNYNPFTGLCY